MWKAWFYAIWRQVKRLWNSLANFLEVTKTMLSVICQNPKPFTQHHPLPCCPPSSMAFLHPKSSFSPQRKNPSLYISLYQYRCSLLAGVAEGTTGIILATSSFLVQGHLLRWAQLPTTESNPSHANWRHENSPSVQPVSSFKECSPCMTEGRKLLAGHPAQPPHSRTNYSSLLWP